MTKLINTILQKEKYLTPPIWIMRQAGRYLPEYREIRTKVSNFLELCYNPKLAAEVTLQPLKRFDLDAAIIFSDILVIPDALGIKVEFVKNEGPKLQKITKKEELKNLKIENIEKHLQPVFEAVSLTKSKLDKEKTLIGFSGSPWTIASYVIEGGGSKNFENIRKIALQDEEFFKQLITILTDSIIVYLKLKIKAGAQIIKLFDSWAGILPPDQYQKWVIDPNKKIISALKEFSPQTPIIAFPRGSGMLYEKFVKEAKPDCLAVDQNLLPKYIKENLQEKLKITVQGNLDNFLLAYDKNNLEKEINEIMINLNHKPFIFNLGHGILQETPIENVQKMIEIIRKFK